MAKVLSREGESPRLRVPVSVGGSRRYDPGAGRAWGFARCCGRGPRRELDTAMVTDTMRFHTDLRNTEISRPESLTAIHAMWAPASRPATTARLADGRVKLPDTCQDQDLTVPIVAACRADVPMDSNTPHRVPRRARHRAPQRRRELEVIWASAPAGAAVGVACTFPAGTCGPPLHVHAGVR